MGYSDQGSFERLKGLTILAIENNTHTDEVHFATDGGLFRMSHHQDCCESVVVDDIVGDLNDLIDSPVLLAEEVTNEGETEYGDEMWTFYKLSTLKGSVTIKWHGSSNGYYSIAVSFEKIG